MVRRKGNKPLPIQTGSVRKRDAKAKEKEEAKTAANGKKGKEEGKTEEKPEEEGEPVVRDELGRIQFAAADFENPLIVHFKTLDQDAKKDENYKVNWKEIEQLVKDKFDRLKNVYTRADKYEGDLAISSHKYNPAQFAELLALKDYELGGKKFAFTKTEGEELNDFWQKQGGHYQYCIAPKLRIAKKLNKAK